MDSRVREMLEQMKKLPDPPQVVPSPTIQAALAPGINQVRAFSKPIAEIEEFTDEVNAFLADLPPEVPVIGSSFVFVDEKLALLLTIRIPLEAGL